MSIQLRTASSGDLALVHAIRRDAILGIATGMARREAQAWADKRSPEFYAERLAAGYVVIAGFRGDDIGWGSSADDRITGLYVRSSLAGRGVGRALLFELEACIRKRGHAYARLDSSPNAVGFYVRLGYVQAGLPGGDGAVPMKKNLLAG